jgi:lipoate-protein ligase A
MAATERAWRLLPDAPGTGAWHMALDDALLDSHRCGFSPPTLRFYSWDPPALSLGYAQARSDVDMAACRKAGVEVIRRPTGGRAVLHRGEFTYAVIASAGFPPSIAGTYRQITEVLAAAIARLGAAVGIAPGQASRAGTPSCFQSATTADLLATGRKLVGSAQTRREGAFLQHGSLMLTQGSAEIQALLARSAEGGAGGEATCLEAVLGRVPARAAIAQVIAEAAEAAWGITLTPAPLTDWERERALERMARYRLDG